MWFLNLILRLIFSSFILMQMNNYNLLKYWYHQLFTMNRLRDYKFKFDFRDYVIVLFAFGFYFLISKWTFELLVSSAIPLNANQWSWFGFVIMMLFIFGQPIFLSISVICTFPVILLHKIFTKNQIKKNQK